MMTKKYPLKVSQAQINALSDKLLDDIDNILDYFGVKYRKTAKKYFGGCPIHGGDPERSPWNLFIDGDYYRGNWKCRSHNCHEVFQKSFIGFIRGLLSRQKHDWSESGDKIVSFQETINWGLEWIKQDLSGLKDIPEEIDKNKFIAQTRVHLVDQDKPKHFISRDFVRKNLNIPAIPFLERNFRAETLDKYDIGVTKSKDPSKEMFERVVVPVYDNDGIFLVGCSGRSIHKQCDRCKLYHSTSDACPKIEETFKFVKWRHSKTLRADKNLFNFWNAKNHIKECGSVILVESVCNVLRLEESGIPIALATFGSHFTEYQQILLSQAGALNLIIIPDNDDAGNTYTDLIRCAYNRLYNIHIINIPKKDVADLANEEVDEFIKPTLRKLGAIK